MAKIRFTPSIVPNLFTAMNMFCGYLSIVNTAQQKYFYAAWLIIIAAAFDALDGFLARLTKSASELGVELDSLSDIVSFGTAPAFLLYSIHLFQFEVWGILVSSLLVIAGGFRLARFNVQLIGFEKKYFKGLPIPMSAILISTFILTFYSESGGFSKLNSELIIPLVLVLSYLMISKVKYDPLPSVKLKSLKENPIKTIFIFISIIALIATNGKALFFIFVLIILFGIFRHIYNMFKHQTK